MQFNLVANLVLSLVCPILLFLEYFQLIIIATMHIIAINELELGAFHLKY
jgi:hypothetical protein